MGESDAAPMPGSAQDANGDTAIVGTASQVARQIQVQYDLKPGPERRWDWEAYRDEEGPHGYGSTRQYAIDDLLWLEAEREAR